MRDFLVQIKNGLDVNLYLLSLFSALAIPDINFLNGEDCYYFRCSLLHQGSSQHSKSWLEKLEIVQSERVASPPEADRCGGRKGGLGEISSNFFESTPQRNE